LKTFVDNIRYPIFLRIPTSDISVYKEIFIQNEYDYYYNNNPCIIVDAGANIGLSAVFYANKFPNSKILAIEPEDSNFNLLKKNVAQYKQIHPIQAALWHEEGTLSVTDIHSGHWGFLVDSETSNNSNNYTVSQSVKSITINSILKDYNISKIDILKIDIEGAEKEVFKDTSYWINKVDSIVIELHERMKVGCCRSFYNGSNGFTYEKYKKNNVFLSRIDQHE
jgi:FkbM family methyltransferase